MNKENINKTSIRKLTYLLMEMPEGGIPTDDARLNYRVAREHILNAVSYFLKGKLMEDSKLTEDYLGESVYKDVEVQENEYGEKFVELFGESITFGEDMNAYELTPKRMNSRWSQDFYPITREQARLQKRLKDVGGVIFYYKEGNKLMILGDVQEGEVFTLGQKNVIPTDDDGELPAEIGSRVLRDAFQTLFPELEARRDNSNDGIPN